MADEEVSLTITHNAALKRDKSGGGFARQKRKKAAAGDGRDFVPDKASQYREEWRSIDEPHKHTEEHIMTITEVSGKSVPKSKYRKEKVMPIKRTYTREVREITEQMERTQWEKAWITRWHNLIDALKEENAEQQEENAEQQEKISKLNRKIRELNKQIKELSE